MVVGILSLLFSLCVMAFCVRAAFHSFDRTDRIHDKHVWRWASAYLRLRDERDAEGDMPVEHR